MYKAVLLDLGKVLIHFDFKKGYRALEGLCPYTAAEIPKRLATTDLVQRFETGLLSSADFVAQMSRILDLRVDYQQFSEIWSCIFSDVLIPEEIIEGLAARYRLVLVSNTNALHFEMLDRAYTLLRHFHARVLSYQVKAMKPRPEIFEAAIQQAGCRPEECFYTDDIFEYVEAAKRMGIDAVQFESREQFERELRARGIVWE